MNKHDEVNGQDTTKFHILSKRFIIYVGPRGRVSVVVTDCTPVRMIHCLHTNEA